MSIEILDNCNPYNDFTPTIMVRKKKIALAVREALRWAYRADRIDDQWLFHVPVALPGDFEIEVTFMLNSVVRATGNNQLILHSFVDGASRPLLFFNSWGSHSGERGTLSATNCHRDGTIITYPGFTTLCMPLTIYVAAIRRVAGVMSGTLRLPTGEVLSSSTSYSADPAVYNMAGPQGLTAERADITYFNLKIWNTGTRTTGTLLGNWDMSDRFGTFFSHPIVENLATAAPIWESSTNQKINPDGSFEYEMIDTWGQRAWRIPVSIEWSRTYILEAECEGWEEGKEIRLALFYAGANASNMPYNDIRRAPFESNSAYYGSFTVTRIFDGKVRFAFTTAAGTGLMSSAHISLRAGMGSENGRRFKIKSVKLSPAYELVGPEIMQNPTLSTIIGTYPATGATLSNVDGALKCDYTAHTASGVDLYLKNTPALIPGKFYKLEVDIVAMSGPAIKLGFSAMAPSWGDIATVVVNAPRQKVEVIFCARDPVARITFRPVTANVGSMTIDNVSLRQIDKFHNPMRLINLNADRWSLVDVGVL